MHLNKIDPTTIGWNSLDEGVFVQEIREWQNTRRVNELMIQIGNLSQYPLGKINKGLRTVILPDEKKEVLEALRAALMKDSEETFSTIRLGYCLNRIDECLGQIII